MEEDKVLMMTTSTGKITAELIGKMIVFSANLAKQRFEQRQWNKELKTTRIGEVSWQSMMSSMHELGIQKLQNTEVNLDKLKVELEKYGIGFAFHKNNDDTVSMAYEIPHEAIVKQGLADVIEKITEKPEEFAENVKQTDKTKKVDEKLNYYKKQEAKDIQANKDKVKNNVVNKDVVHKTGVENVVKTRGGTPK